MRIALRACTALLLAAAATAAGSCGSAAPRPPALFPVASVWVAPVEDTIEGELASDGRRVFVSTRSGEVRAVDLAGSTAWKRGGLPGRLSAASGVLVLRQEDGAVVSLDPETGASRWMAASGVKGLVPAALDGDRVVVAGEGAAALDLATGRVLWALPNGGPASAPPVAHATRVFVAQADGALACRDRASGQVLWSFRTAEPLLASPIVDSRRRLYLGTSDGRLLGLSVDKGEPAWRWKVGADVASPPALLENRVLFTSYEGVLYALNRGNGHLAWRAPLPSRPISGPLVVGQAVLVACREADIVGIDGRNGKRLGALKTPAEIRTAPILIGDRLYVGLRDRTLAAFQLDMTPKVDTPETPAPGAGRQRRGRRQGTP